MSKIFDEFISNNGFNRVKGNIRSKFEIEFSSGYFTLYWNMTGDKILKYKDKEIYKGIMPRTQGVVGRYENDFKEMSILIRDLKFKEILE